MTRTTRALFVAALAIIAVAAFQPGLQAQLYSNQKYYPVPWPKPWTPDGADGGFSFGPTTALFSDPTRDAIWIATRCGRTPNYHSSNEGCVFKPTYNNIFVFDLDGNLISRFGAGTIGGPHSMFVDRQGNAYIADEGGGAEFGHTGAEVDAEMLRRGIGAQVVKYSPTGQILMKIGTPGVPGGDETHLNHPSSVAVAPDGSIFVGDSHGGNPNRRIIKYSANGTFIKQIGCSACGSERVANTAWGRFSDAHAMTFDSQGRLFVGDKGNYRVQIFDQDLNLLDVWTQFGAPAGIAIQEGTDMLVTADAESHNSPPMDGSPANAGVQQGLYIGDARSGWVSSFVLALAPPISGGDGAPEGVAVDRYGSLYWGETRSAPDIRRSQHVMKYVDITRTPHATCEWWGYESDRAGRGVTGCGVDETSRMER